ncbi:hypothetical protein M441DRAFT_38171 [Trichoderma asperellum CBS 433.97]|uniref:Protein kinase domain-containing protein n=1 Tax=Trichoderma asperellum (strain ATCC 204424 / CBS 433.97 / NBRC 101777) TaxID=1042311 RepID=A0A2T3Z6G6_TRIA4|nr:hypothetical protein M441DRAFT_38171 [Trichoderma asperellum CBS 433.97]PTB40397.1 hypothetical protein M441DRAFT_38171 [Trichoderma asperellum CBS 433.97]
MYNNNRRTKMFYADIERKQLGRGVQAPTGAQLSPVNDRTLEGLSTRGVRWPTNEPLDIVEERSNASSTDRPLQKAETIAEPSEETFKHPLPKAHKDQYKGSVTLLDLGGEVRVVQKRGLSELYAARQLHKDNVHGIISQLNDIRHENLVAAIETFTEGSNSYIVIDKMLLSLHQVVRSPPIPSAEEIGVIMGQILDGLIYLQNKGLAHGALNCLGVLIDETGNVKLTTHELFIQTSREAIAKDMKSIAEISMMLMQKYKLDNGKVGVEKVEPWKNSGILDFLSYTTSCEGCVDLRQDPFISSLWKKGFGWPKEKLRGLVEIARLTVPRNFRYNEKSAIHSRHFEPTHHFSAYGR